MAVLTSLKLPVALIFRFDSRLIVQTGQVLDISRCDTVLLSSRSKTSIYAIPIGFPLSKVLCKQNVVVVVVILLLDLESLQLQLQEQKLRVVEAQVLLEAVVLGLDGHQLSSQFFNLHCLSVADVLALVVALAKRFICLC